MNTRKPYQEEFTKILHQEKPTNAHEMEYVSNLLHNSLELAIIEYIGNKQEFTNYFPKF